MKEQTLQVTQRDPRRHEEIPGSKDQNEEPPTKRKEADSPPTSQRLPWEQEDSAVKPEQRWTKRSPGWNRTPSRLACRYGGGRRAFPGV